MANFEEELPNDLIKEFENIEVNTPKMMQEMTKEGAKVVYNNVQNNMKRAFKTTRALEKGLRITKVYHTSNGEVATKIAFYGYDKEKKKQAISRGNAYTVNCFSKRIWDKLWRKKKPFFRTAFKSKEIEDAMLKVQEKYISEE